MDNKIPIVVDVQNGFIKTQEHIEKANQIVALVKSGKFDKKSSQLNSLTILTVCMKDTLTGLT